MSKTKFEPDQTITELPRPRVLVLGWGESWVNLATELEAKVATVRHAQSSSSVNFSEWDCVVSDGVPMSFMELNRTHADWEEPSDGSSAYRWEQHYPSPLSIVIFFGDPESNRGFRVLDAYPPNGEGDEAPVDALIADGGHVGTHLTTVKGLPDSLDRLVRASLVPAMKDRDEHFCFDHRTFEKQEKSDIGFRPFLYGPDELPLAASYRRAEGGNVWLLPSDMPNHALWVLEALREWHDVDPKRFPAIPDWQSDPEFRSMEEARVGTELEAKRQRIIALFNAYETERVELEGQLENLKKSADTYERALLTEQGTPLQNSILRALRDLGFEVEDMDAVNPEGSRKEDYRIRDTEDSNWIALGDAKGVKGGVPESVFTQLGRWVEFYIIQEKVAPTARWSIANYYRLDDPNTRPEPFANRPDNVEVFTAANGLLLDTRALFKFLRIAQDHPERKSAIRAFLRSRKGVLSGSTDSVQIWPTDITGLAQAGGAEQPPRTHDD